jgi:VWFA-related protein
MLSKLLAVLCVAGSIALAAAQTPQTPQSPATFKAGVTLVQLDVSVLDKKTHRPVHGLTAADFSVSEDGRPQTIAAFAAVDVPDPVPLPTVDGKPVTWLRDVAPDVQSNALAGKPESRLFVMLIDDAMIPDDPWMIRQAKTAAHSVIAKLGLADRMAVVLSMESGSAQDFTSDRSRLDAAVEKMHLGYSTYFFGYDNADSSSRLQLQGQASRRSPSGAKPGVIPSSPGKPGVDDDIQFREMTFSTLVNVAEALMASPERRKALVYISPGVPVNFNGVPPPVVNQEANARLMEELPEIFRRMQRANINVYAIDPTGLNGMENTVAKALEGLPIDRRPPVPDILRLSHDIHNTYVDFILAAANSTGGRAIVNTNDVEPGIQQIFLENGSFYLLGYEPPPKDPPGTLHRLKVEVNRKDVEVRTRSGYYTPKPAKVDPRHPVTPMQRAVASVLPTADLPLRVALAPFAAATGAAGPATRRPAATVAIVLGLERREPAQSISDTIEIVTSAFTPDGRLRGSQTQTARVALRPASGGDVVHYEALSRMDLAPGRYQLRIAAHSTASDATGSVFADVEIPDFAKAPLSVSGVLLGLDPPVASAPRDAFAALGPLIPTAERSFDPRDRATAFLRVYQGGTTALASVRVAVRLVTDHDVAIVNRVETLGTDRFDAIARSADYRCELPLVSLAPGPYLMTIEAALGGTTTRRDVRFEVR